MNDNESHLTGTAIENETQTLPKCKLTGENVSQSYGGAFSPFL